MNDDTGILLQKHYTGALDTIINSTQTDIKKIFDDDEHLKELYDVHNRPVLVVDNATTKGFSLKEAMIQYEQNGIEHKLYVHDCMLTTLQHYCKVMHNDWGRTDYYWPNDMIDRNQIILIQTENSGNDISDRMKGNFELDDIFYGVGEVPLLPRNLLINAQKANIEYTANTYSKVVYPGNDKKNIGKVKDGVFDLENVIITIDDKTKPAPLDYSWIPDIDSQTPIKIVMSMGASLSALGAYLLTLPNPDPSGKGLGVLGGFFLIGGPILSGLGYMNYRNREKYNNYKNNLKPQLNISFSGLLTDFGGKKNG